MNAYFYIIEISTYIVAIILIFDARNRGIRWLTTYITSMLFGLVAELSIVLLSNHDSTHYEYGKFLIMIGPQGRDVPLWVGMGWGVIVYSAVWTAQKLKLSWIFRPLAAGILAVNIDLSLDPIADLLGFWKWKNVPVSELTYFSIPFDNFLGWFLIVASFSLFTRIGFHLWPVGKYFSDYWVPLLGALVSVVVMVPIRYAVPYIYNIFNGEIIPFFIVFSISCFIAWAFALKSRRDHPKNWYVLAVPCFYHLLLLIFLLVSEGYKKMPELIVVIPVNFFLGFFAYAWLSLDSFFPEGNSIAND